MKTPAPALPTSRSGGTEGAAGEIIGADRAGSIAQAQINGDGMGAAVLCEGSAAVKSHRSVSGAELAGLQAVSPLTAGFMSQAQGVGDGMGAAGLIKNAGAEITHYRIVGVQYAIQLQVIGPGAASLGTQDQGRGVVHRMGAAGLSKGADPGVADDGIGGGEDAAGLVKDWRLDPPPTLGRLR